MRPRARWDCKSSFSTRAPSGEIDAAFAALVRERAHALTVGGDGFFNSRRVQFAADAPSARPSAVVFCLRAYMSSWSGSIEIDNGADIADMFRQGLSSPYREHLQGPRASQLPVLQSTKFEFLINLQHRQGPRPRCAANASRPRRRGDRMIAAVHEFVPALSGGSRMSAPCSLLGCKAEMFRTGPIRRF